jgi:N6-adenosine-specific RNA methylase IME4
LNFRIDPDIRSHIPPLREDELRQLEENMLRDGCKAPLVVWDGVLLDGHNRFDICERHGLPFTTETIELPNREAAIAWIEDNQLGRRNLTADQFSYFIGRKYERIKRSHGGAREASGQNDHLKTATAVAEQHGVSEKTVRRAGDYANDVDAIADQVGSEARTDILSGKSGLTRTEVGEVADALAEGEVRFSSMGEAITWAKEYAQAERVRKADAKKDERAAKEAELGARQSALPNKKYGVIYADPEWRFEVYSRETGLNAAADNHYPTSPLDEIKARDVPSIAAKDCVLFLWATAPMMPQALEVMAAWGFEYKSQFTWAKDRAGTGYWNRNQHELLLVGTHGNIPAPALGTQFSSLIVAPRREHSHKPDEAYEIIEAYFPTLPKIELNARHARPGWDAWGYEAPALKEAA